VPRSFQLKLPAAELQRLGQRVAEDYRGAIIDHNERMEKFRAYFQSFRGRVNPPRAGDELKSNFRVPVTQWNQFTEWARENGALFGDDAQIIAKPVGPNDESLTPKVGLYVSWRMFNSMRMLNPLSVFIFRKILFGHTYAYRPWVQKRFDTMAPGRRGEQQVQSQIYYEGPDFLPLWPDDVIEPAEDVESLHELSFIMRRYRATPDQLLRGDGTIYQGIRQNFSRIVELGRRQQREPIGEEIKAEKDLDEGVLYSHSQSAGDSLIVHEWYGRWRPLLKGETDADPLDFSRRSMYEQEIVVRTLPDLSDMVIGVQDLMTLYPKMQHRRPFVEALSYRDGTRWPMGIGEMLEQIEAEASANHNLFTDAQQLTVWPLIFYSPSSGWDPKAQKYGPGEAIPSEHPEKVNVVKVQADLQGCVVKEQSVLAYAERVTGNSDQAMGRAIDRPNAPRTATGQIALIQQGNVRADLDMRFLREDVGAIARDIWELDQQFCTEDVFFRVTGDDADGLFDTKHGGAYMTPSERGGMYDFDIEFATNVWSREADKQKALQLYELDLQNPLIAQNPTALWLVTNRMHKALGDDDFASIVPQPPDADRPRNPKEEWSMIQRGEDVHVNPADNDDFHLQDHQRRLVDYVQMKGQSYDKAAVNQMAAHIQEHKAQKGQKMLMQSMVNQIVRSLAPQQQSPIPPTPAQQVLQSPAAGGIVPGLPAGGPSGPPAPAGATL
jgi:hypothetical protein